jgi:hypothetical protein
MSKDSNVAGGNDESSQNPFGSISDFFEQVGKVLMGAFKPFTDFLSSLFGGSDDSASLNVNPVKKNRIVERSSFISESSQSEDKKEKFISSCAMMFVSSDKFGEFSREPSMDNKKNILKQYFREVFPAQSCFDEDMVNKIYKNLSEEFVSTNEEMDQSFANQSFESFPISSNEHNHYDEEIKNTANVYFGIFLSSDEVTRDNFFEKNFEDKKIVLKKYFEEIFDKNSENEDKLFTKFPDLLDAIVEVTNKYGPATQSFREGGRTRVEKLSLRDSKALTPR